MRYLLFISLIAASLTTVAQKNVVEIEFNELVAIQSLDKETKFNTYFPVWNDKGSFLIEIHADEELIHLIVHTEDNEQYNLVVVAADEKKERPKIQWSRKDTVIDFSNY